MKRRDLLLGLGAGCLALKGIQLRAAPASDTRFLLVFLRGAYDCAQTLVPYASADYREARPTLALPPPRPGDPAATLALDGNWGLNPVLKESLMPLWDKKQLAFIPFFGTADASRSHFETQARMEMGEAPVGQRSGFLNRLVQAVGDARPVAFSVQPPLILQGSRPVPNLSLKRAGPSRIAPRQAELLNQLYRGQALETQVREGLQAQKEMTEEARQNIDQNAPGSSGFEQEARKVARLMNQRYTMGFLDIGGWDTHINQAQRLDLALKSLGSGLAAFAQEMGSAWDRTMVVVLSEFGRTFLENGNGGTDHGHGSTAWVLGGALRGGRILGEQVPVDRGHLFQDRDFPVLNEYRAVLGGLFKGLYGLTSTQLAQVFPGGKITDLGLV
ncbi:MAG: DUF1501 domain-containing protein [Firmicutes bacterium]|nr:DUF1501 domain-containing protein [Bacillota bacterium]